MRIIDPSSKFKLPDSVRKVLLIQLGDIGDVVWTTPSIRAAKNAVPHGKVSVMVREGFGGLLEADPSVDRVFEVKQYRGNLFHRVVGQLSFLKSIRSQHFDLAVDLRLGDRGAFAAWITGAPIRVTFYHAEVMPFWRPFCFTHGVLPVNDGARHRGGTEHILRIIRPLGMNTDDPIPRLWISDEARMRAGKILPREKVKGEKQYITINPCSRWSYKEWDNRKWAQLLERVWTDFGLISLVIGSAEERPQVEELIRQCRVPAVNLAGQTTLAELAAVLSQSRLHIGVDSAAPHIAAAVGVPTVTIYGPSSWFDWAPVGESHRVVLPEMDCVPCHQKGCVGSGRSRCLEELTVEQVVKTVRETLESKETAKSDSSNAKTKTGNS